MAHGRNIMYITSLPRELTWLTQHKHFLSPALISQWGLLASLVCFVSLEIRYFVHVPCTTRRHFISVLDVHPFSHFGWYVLSIKNPFEYISHPDLKSGFWSKMCTKILQNYDYSFIRTEIHILGDYSTYSYILLALHASGTPLNSMQKLTGGARESKGRKPGEEWGQINSYLMRGRETTAPKDGCLHARFM